MNCDHMRRYYAREDEHEPQPPSAGNFCTKTGYAWCEDCNELLWKYKVYLDGSRVELVNLPRKRRSIEHHREEEP